MNQREEHDAAPDVADFFSGNPLSQPFFNLAGDSIPGASSDVLGLVTMGGAYSTGGSGSRTYMNSATFAIDLSSLINPRQSLVVAFLDTNIQGAGFDSLQLQISREGATVLNQTFLTTAEANAFLNDAVINLGSNAAANVSGNLDLVFTTTVITNDPGAGYFFDLLFGNATFGSADFNADGAVDGADLLIWQRNLGQAAGATRATGDADGDGAVDGDDLSTFNTQFGFVAQSVAAAAPEPSTAILAGTTILALRRRRAMGHRQEATA